LLDFLIPRFFLLYYRPTGHIFLQTKWLLFACQYCHPYGPAKSLALVVRNCHSSQLDMVLRSAQLLFQHAHTDRIAIAFTPHAYTSLTPIHHLYQYSITPPETVIFDDQRDLKRTITRDQGCFRQDRLSTSNYRQGSAWCLDDN
jgi:hypothetical protein